MFGSEKNRHTIIRKTMSVRTMTICVQVIIMANVIHTKII